MIKWEKSDLSPIKMEKVFAKALGVEDPWFIRQITFNKEAHRLDVDIDFKKGSRFPIEEGGKNYPVYDSEKKTGDT